MGAGMPPQGPQGVALVERRKQTGEQGIVLWSEDHDRERKEMIKRSQSPPSLREVSPKLQPRWE